MVSSRESLPSFSRPAWATGDHGYQKLERAIAVAVGEGFLAGAREGLWWRNVALLACSYAGGACLLSVLLVLLSGTYTFIIVTSS